MLTQRLDTHFGYLTSKFYSPSLHRKTVITNWKKQLFEINSKLHLINWFLFVSSMHWLQYTHQHAIVAQNTCLRNCLSIYKYSFLRVLCSEYCGETMSVSRILYAVRISEILLDALHLASRLFAISWRLCWRTQTTLDNALVSFIVTWIEVTIRSRWCRSIRIHHGPSPKAPRWNNMCTVCKHSTTILI